MPSLSLKDQDKIAWSWAESTDPKNITSEHVAAAYRIKHNVCKRKSCRRNCKGNPYCLTGLGENRLIESIKNPNDDIDITLAKRIPGTFVGLTNLGATCYVNSLLQLWFHNKVFRDAILSWNPLEDPVEQNNISLQTDSGFHPQTVIGHLQQLFALMCHSERRCIDPSPLIESLGLDTNTQQDAQEFSKLFISLLENSLRHQRSPAVHNLISNNFRGEYSYVTRCCKCMTESISQSMFYELELNVKGHNTLYECLEEFLHEEKLDGTNCYSCTVCNEKQEACRFIKLHSLPPVLNLQLLRFVYDREKGQKKKLKTVIQFPEVLDMSQFVHSRTNLAKPLLYNLSAVLIHTGSQAYSGHFVAYIKDEVSGAWNIFNDASVIKSEGKKLELDEDNSENVKKVKPPKSLKGFQSSTDAYMLVYTSVNHNPRSIDEVKLSNRLKDFVASQNNNFDQLRREIVANKEHCLNKYEEVLNIFKLLSVENIDDITKIDVLSLEWLTTWLDCKNNTTQQIDNNKLICPHGLLNPKAVPTAKYISQTSADILYAHHYGGPRLKLSESLCEDCVMNQCLIYRTKAKTLEESKEITNILKKRMGLDEPGYYVDKYCLKTWRTQVLNLIDGTNRISQNGIDSMNDETEEDSLPASQSSSNNKKDSVMNNNELNGSNKDIVVTKETNIKSEYYVQTQRRVVRNKYLNSRHRRKQNPTITVPLRDIRNCFVLCQRLEGSLNNTNILSTSNTIDLANQCKQLKIRLRRLSIPHKTIKLSAIPRRCALDNNTSDNVYNLPSDVFLKAPNHCNGKRTEIIESTEKVNESEDKKMNTDVDPNKVFNEGILCCHGNLSIEEADRKLVPKRVWDILKQYFPSALSFPQDTQPCLQCQKLASKEDVVKQQYYECAINQKKTFSDLINLRNRPIISKNNGLIYLLPKENFYQPWLSFIKSATRRDNGSIVDPPVSLNLNTLICVHGLLHYSPKYEEDMARIVLVSQQEWEGLTSLYIADNTVTVAPDGTTQPELCQYCFSVRLENEEKEKLNYKRARINIRLVPSAPSLDVHESSELPTGKRPRIDDGSYDCSPDFIPAESKKGASASAPAPATDVRRSGRTRRARGQKDVQFTVSSTLTLRELKQMITNQMAVAPFDQHLSTITGKELEGDYQTLSEFGILPNATLLLQVDEAKESFDMLEECSQPEPEAGFKGTGLLQAF